MTRVDRAAEALRSLDIDPTLPVDEIYTQLRHTDGGNYAKLFTTNAYKAQLSQARGVLSGVQYLAPHTQSGIEGYTSCPFASEGCAATCLTGTGHMVTDIAAVARLRRTLRWFLLPKRALHDLHGEVLMLEGRAIRDDFRPTLRLNGTSDLPFWSWLDSSQYDTVLYDYTKRPPVQAMRDAWYQHRWHFTFSLSERPDSLLLSEKWAALGVNTAMVVSGPPGSTSTTAKAVAKLLIARGEFAGRPTFDGDRDDLRWLDPRVGGWVILSAKGGDAKSEDHGFVVRFDPDVLADERNDPTSALLSPADVARFITPDRLAVASK